MPQAERLFHICRRLNEGARVSVPSLMDELEVSRATVFRDMELLRDRLHAPLVWDADDGTYRLESGTGVDARFILPGMWMEARQLYGMLTVINIAAAVDPGVAGKYRREYGGLLKRAMADHDIRGYGLDRKISVELPQPPEAAQAAMGVIGPALMLDAPIRLRADGLAPEGATVVPTGLRLRSDGWWLEYRGEGHDPPGALRLGDVRSAEAIGNLVDLRADPS
jgi:predicted DNA-binding transcriptional regulator YafY